MFTLLIHLIMTLWSRNMSWKLNNKCIYLRSNWIQLGETDCLYDWSSGSLALHDAYDSSTFLRVCVTGLQIDPKFVDWQIVFSYKENVFFLCTNARPSSTRHQSSIANMTFERRAQVCSSPHPGSGGKTISLACQHICSFRRCYGVVLGSIRGRVIHSKSLQRHLTAGLPSTSVTRSKQLSETLFRESVAFL
jgi:hypothetical protein